MSVPPTLFAIDCPIFGIFIENFMTLKWIELEVFLISLNRMEVGGTHISSYLKISHNLHTEFQLKY